MIFIGALVLDWKVRRLIGTVVSLLCILLNLVDHSAQEWRGCWWMCWWADGATELFAGSVRILIGVQGCPGPLVWGALVL